MAETNYSTRPMGNPNTEGTLTLDSNMAHKATSVDKKRIASVIAFIVLIALNIFAAFYLGWCLYELLG